MNKFYLIFLCGILFLFNNGDLFSQTELNISEDNFLLNANCFDKDNSTVAKYAIELNDCYIVAGQAFNKNKDIINNSAIIKLSKEGELIKTVFLGSEDVLNRMSMKTVYLINDRIIQLGTKRKKNRSYLWLREIDSDLNVINEKEFEEFTVADGSDPIVLSDNKKRIYIITKTDDSESIKNGINLSQLSTNFELVKSQYISLIEPHLNVQHVAATLNGKRIFITAFVCVEKTNNICNREKTILFDLNLKSNSIKRVKIIPKESFIGKKLLINKNKLFLIGSQSVFNKSINKYEKYTSVDIFDLKFNKIGEFTSKTDEIGLHEIAIDAIILNDTLKIVGENYKMKTIPSNSFYLSFDLKGNLIENKTFRFSSKNLNNTFRKIIPLSNNSYMILGMGDGWRILIK